MKRLWEFLYSLYILNITYKLDERAKIALVYKNKPIFALSGEEQEKIQQLMTHFSTLGYFVLIKGR